MTSPGFALGPGWWYRSPEKTLRLARRSRRPEHYFYPDFVVCVTHEPGQPPLQRLLETKNDTKDAARKARHSPPAYGKVLFITKDHGLWCWIMDNGSPGDAVKLSEMDAILKRLRSTQPDERRDCCAGRGR